MPFIFIAIIASVLIGAAASFHSNNSTQLSIHSNEGIKVGTVTLIPTDTLTSFPTVTFIPSPTVKFLPRATIMPQTYTITPVQKILPSDTSNGLSNSSDNEVHTPAYSTNDSIPAGATAKCSDGTYSFSQNSRGTCSHHKGVIQWL